MSYEVKQGAMTDRIWAEMKQMAQDYVCTQCGGELTVHTNAEKGTIEVGCLNPEHHGWIERETYTQSMRRGEDIHPAIRATIERKMMPKEELGRAMNMLALRYPKAIVDAGTATLFIMDCMRLDIDPLISPAEAIPVPFKTTLQDGTIKPTIQMVITEDGWLSMAARGCPDRWAGSPSVEVVNDKELAKSLCGDADAWLWKATGRTKDMEPEQTSMAYGYYTHTEHENARNKKLPAATQPGNQARIRAIKRWVRENFAECRQNMMDMTAEWFQRAEGVKAAKEFIDAEYSLLALPEPLGGGELASQSTKGDEKTGEPPAADIREDGKGDETDLPSPKVTTKPEKIGAPAAEPEAQIEGEGFTIKLAWLKESLKELKWSENTCKTFLVGRYKVSPQGTLEEVIKRLTREQAEEFTKEIQGRVERHQPGLFD